MGQSITPATIRSRRHYTVGAPDECWEWTGKRNGAGYGVIRTGGANHRYTRAHRAVYEDRIGPIPADCRVLMHTCDNPICVNPAHLVPGNDADNMWDKALKGRHSKKLTADDVRQIRSLAVTHTQREIAAVFGVSHQMIGYILRGEQWGHVT